MENEVIFSLPGAGKAMRTFELQTNPRAFVAVFGAISPASTPLVRVHSSCKYSELLGARDCDCAKQLKLALKQIKKDGEGILIYLDQEARGHGIAMKTRIYKTMQDLHVDTVDACHALGMAPDAREYSQAASILAKLGVTKIRLLTNNLHKINSLEKYGLCITRVPLQTKPTKCNVDYLRTKQKKMKQDLGIVDKDLN